MPFDPETASYNFPLFSFVFLFFLCLHSVPSFSLLLIIPKAAWPSVNWFHWIQSIKIQLNSEKIMFCFSLTELFFFFNELFLLCGNRAKWYAYSRPFLAGKQTCLLPLIWWVADSLHPSFHQAGCWEVENKLGIWKMMHNYLSAEFKRLYKKNRSRIFD